MALSDRLKALFRRQGPAVRSGSQWPFVPGRYLVVDDTAPVIVVMPDNEALAETLSGLSVQGLCMISPVCRGVADVEKLTRNVEANLAVRCLVLAGGEADREYPAVEALRAIFDDETDISDKAREIAHGARGKLKAFDFTALQKRVHVVDMLDCGEADKLVAGVVKHGTENHRPDTGFVVQGDDSQAGVQRLLAPTGIAHDYQVDKAGKFVIDTDKNDIVVEHYNSKGELLRIIQGSSARDLCLMLIRNGWVSRLDHAAYLGRELALAETAVRQGLPYERKGGPADNDDAGKPDRK